MKIKNKSSVRIIGIESYGLNHTLQGVYIRFSKNSVSRSREVAPEVFADFDRHGAIVGLEFSNPGDYDIDAMQHVLGSGQCSTAPRYR